MIGIRLSSFERLSIKGNALMASVRQKVTAAAVHDLESPVVSILREPQSKK